MTGQFQDILITVVGDSPLICDRWEPARYLVIPTPAKTPEEEYLDSMYRLPDGGYGFPAAGFKLGLVSVAEMISGNAPRTTTQSISVMGSLVKLIGEPLMRVDCVKLGRKAVHRRYSAEFPDWSASMVVRFDASVFTGGQVASLFDIAGSTVGIGRWRPAMSGAFGVFRVVRPPMETAA